MRISGQQFHQLLGIQESLDKIRVICRQMGWEHPDTFRISSDKATATFEMLGGGTYMVLERVRIGNE